MSDEQMFVVFTFSSRLKSTVHFFLHMGWAKSTPPHACMPLLKPCMTEVVVTFIAIVWPIDRAMRL